MRLRKLSRSSIKVPQEIRKSLLATITHHFARKSETWMEGLSDVLKKDITSVSVNADSLALDKFLLTEELCRKTNRRLIASPVSNELDAVLQRTQSLIHRCLGYDFDVCELLDSGRFGPGSSYSCRGSQASGSHKFSSNEITYEASRFTSMLIAKHAPSWSLYLTDSTDASPMFQNRHHGRLSFVPKNNDISRTIIIEPELNTFFQLAIGSMIRKRVKRSFRLDLNNSDKDNRRLAHLGSIDDTLATVDFSSASDTISIELLRLLLPPSWFDVIMLYRTGSVKLPDGRIIRLEKVSSMGNGYTWELESLIFHALAVAVCDVEGYNSFWCNTFGDDVIIPSGCYAKFAEASNYLGFVVNNDKSFVKGPFRESCGKDYYCGLDIRCLYMGDSTSYLSIINFINQLQRSHHETYKLLAVKLIKYIPPNLAIWGCRHDGCLWKDGRSFTLNDPKHATWEGVNHFHVRTVVKQYPYPNDRFTILAKVHTLRQDSQTFMSREVSHYVVERVFTPFSTH